MESESEILEMLNKLSAEMCSKFDGIHFEINSMKSAISTLNKKIEKNRIIVEKIDKSLEELSKISAPSCINASDKDTSCITKKIDSIKDMLSDSSQAISSINNKSSSKLTVISQDLKFLTHKVVQSERDLFNIQEELKNK